MTFPPPCLTHLSFTPHLVATTHAWHHLNQISLSWSHQTTGHGSSSSMSLVCLSSAICLQAFLCIIFRRGFLLDNSHADQFDAVCSVWSEHWQADPPPLQPLQALIRLISKTQPLDMTLSTCTQLFGRPWRGLFWVEPVLLNRCMVLATVLQLSFRVLANLLIAYTILCRATILFFRSSESSLPWGAMLNSSDQYERVRVIKPNWHTWDHVTLMSHMTPGRENG